MESVGGAFPDAEWDSISRMLNADQGFDDHASHLLGQYQFPHERDDSFVISSFGATESSFCSLDGLSSGLQYTFQESSLGSDDCYYFNNCSDAIMSTDVYMTNNECSDINLSETPKKRARASRAVRGSPKSKKARKVMTNGKDEEEEEGNGVQDPQSSSSCSSEGGEEQTRVEPETPLPPLAVSGKTRASRGSATDPQSLYARKRREKINERLRTLQTLVPNGTKVDISTMLEEAVQYVKFLQLQIKLLSSDDMWMYAPIAYNGMDLGLNCRMSPASL